MRNGSGDSRTLGCLWLVYGCLRIVAVAWLVVYSSTLALMWGALLNRVPDPFTWMTFFHAMLVVAAAWCIVSAFFSFIAGIGLMRGSASAQTTGLVAALLALPDMPFGVMLGAYSLVALMPYTSPRPEISRASSPIVLPLEPQKARTR